MAGLLAGLLVGPALAQVPTITGLAPVRNARAAVQSASVAVTFDQSMSGSAASAGAVKVFSHQRGGRMSGAQGGAASVSGNTITFNPTTNFRPGETVFVSTTTAAQSGAGANLAAGHVHQFTAAAGAGPGNFINTSDPAVGSLPRSVAVGDVDNDGDLDLLTANYSGGTVSVRLNDGTGAFGSGTEVPTGSTSLWSVALGDVDADGDLDFVTATEQTGGNVSVRLNDGTGTFGGGSTASVGGRPRCVVLGDVDGDGDLDLLTSSYAINASGSLVSVRLNDGSGNYGGGSNYGVGIGPRSVAVADIDGDGDLDFVATTNDANIDLNRVAVWRNNGTGTFSPDADYNVGSNPRNVAIGDIDGDGDLDLLTANSGSSNVWVFLNNGSGTFSAGTPVALSDRPAGVALGDVDGDGDLDLLTSNYQSFTVSVARNAGNGTFGAATNIGVNGDAHNLAVGDLDGDGDLDLLAVGFSGSLVSVLLNRAPVPTLTSLSPTSAPVGTSITLTGTDFTGATAVSFNGTAAVTFSVTTATTATATVPVGAATGPVTITTPGGTSNGVAFTVVVAPVVTAVSPTRNLRNAARTSNVAITFDQPMSGAVASAASVKVFSAQRGGRMSNGQDGVTSVSGNTISFNPTTDFKPGETVRVTTTTGAQSSAGGNLAAGHVHQFTTATGGTGVGLFVAPGVNPDPGVGSGPWAVAVGDVDGDGDLDFVTANNGSGTASVRLNNGTGNFTVPATTPEVPAAGNARRLTLGDVDGDGDLDLLVANFGSNTVSVRLNDGTGGFAAPVTNPNPSVGAGPFDLAMGDVDGDGDLDLVTANRNGNSASVRLNDGTGNFTAPATTPEVSVGINPLGVALGDVDGDGDLDLLTANSGANNVSVRLNDGTGSFAPPATTPQVPGGTLPRSLALGDVDGDGDLDFVTANNGNASASVRLNDGTGSFAAPAANPETSVDALPESIILGDVDGDGDLDFISSGSVVSMRRNDGTGAFSGSVNVATGTSPRYAALGDVDGDGDLDLLTANTTANNVSVRLNQPLPAAPVITALSPTRNRREAPASASVAVTFDQPMSGAAASAASVKVFSQQRGGRMSGTQGGAATVSGNTITFNPTANFRPGETVFVTTTPAAQSTGGANLAAGHVHQFTAAAGAGPAVFGGGQNLTVSTNTAPALAAGDVDGDGDADLVTITLPSGPGAGVAVYLNDGTGTLALHPTTPVSVLSVNSVGDMTLADVDGDGDLDLLIGERDAVRVLTNTGTGVFTQVQSVPLADDGNRVVVGDVDADGDLDAAVSVRNGTVAVLRNDGSGSFAVAGTHSVGSRDGEVAFGDLDADGDLDLVAFSPGAGGDGLVLRNDGTGTFGNATILSGNRAGTALADIDADGDLDLLTSANIGAGVGAVFVQRNDGTGTFAAVSQQVPVGNTPEALTTADFNGDGHLDLLIANTLGGTLSVRLNDGTGTFATTGEEIAVGSQSRKPVAVDLDGDGDLDVLAAGLFNNRVITRFNQLLDLVVSTPQNVPGGAYNSITVTGTGSADIGGPISVVSHFTVQPGGEVFTNCHLISGPGTFTLAARATLRICSAQGISATGATGSVQVTGTRTYSANARYAYNGVGAQVTGTGLPGRVLALELSGNGPLTLTNPLAVRQTVQLGSGNLLLSDKMLTLLSNADTTAMVINGGSGAVVGTATVQRFIAPGTAPGVGYRHLSSPVANTTVADFATAGAPGFTPIANAAYNAIPAPALPVSAFPTVFGFDEARGGAANQNFLVGYFSPVGSGGTALDAPLVAGRGYSVWMRPLTPDFVGTLGNGSVTLPNLTRTGAAADNLDKAGWHLLGNPYPSPIDWDAVTPGNGPGQLPPGMSASISVFKGTGGSTGAYRTRANGLGSLPDGLVPMGGAFFARVTGAGPVAFTFSNALRPLAYANPTQFRAAPGNQTAAAATDPRPRIKVQLAAVGAPADAADEATIYFESGATLALDDWFDGARPGRNLGVPTIASLTTQGEELAINGLPEALLTAASATTVELLAVLPAPGRYTFRISEMHHFSGNQSASVTLLDRLTNTRYDLAHAAPTLTLTAIRADEEIRGRFALVFAAEQVLSNSKLETENSKLQLWPNPAHGTVRVRVPTGTARLDVLDAAGRMVRTLSAPAPDTVLDLPPGFYVLRAGELAARLVVE